MTLVDLNILLYAVNRDAPEHERARLWWERALNGDEPVGLPWVVVLGFIRLSTNPRVFTRPLTSGAALEKIESWLAREPVRLVREKDDHWATLSSILERTGSAANLTTDAQLAALAISHDAVLVSSDAGFARVKGLRWKNPLQ